MDRVPSGWVRCRCGFESSPFKSSARRTSVGVYGPASRIDPENAKVKAITFPDGEVRTAPGARAAATEEWRSSATPPRARRHDRTGTRSASTAPKAVAPGAPRGGDRLGEEATAPTTIRRGREPSSTTHRAGSASRCHGRVATERHAAASEAARPSWRQERQLGAAGSGAVNAA